MANARDSYPPPAVQNWSRTILDRIELEDAAYLVVEAVSQPGKPGRIVVTHISQTPDGIAANGLINISTRYWLLSMGGRLWHMEPPRFIYDLHGLSNVVGRMPEPDEGDDA